LAARLLRQVFGAADTHLKPCPGGAGISRRHAGQRRPEFAHPWSRPIDAIPEQAQAPGYSREYQ
jgi:hypothetical protein